MDGKAAAAGRLVQCPVWERDPRFTV